MVHPGSGQGLGVLPEDHLGRGLDPAQGAFDLEPGLDPSPDQLTVGSQGQNLSRRGLMITGRGDRRIDQEARARNVRCSLKSTSAWLARLPRRRSKVETGRHGIRCELLNLLKNVVFQELF